MSVYIKGMEMPKGGYRTVEIAFDADGHPMALCDGGDVFDVIPVPPHGRLIDADEIRDEWLINGENEYVYDTNAFLESIDNQPTVIPDDFGGADGK